MSLCFHSTMLLASSCLWFGWVFFLHFFLVVVCFQSLTSTVPSMNNTMKCCGLCQDLPDISLHVKHFSSLDSPDCIPSRRQGLFSGSLRFPRRNTAQSVPLLLTIISGTSQREVEHSRLNSEEAQSTCLSGTASREGRGSRLSEYENGEAATGSSRLHCRSSYCWGKGSQKERDSLVMSWFWLQTSAA